MPTHEVVRFARRRRVDATVASDETARKIADVVNQKMAEWNMRAVILKVTKGDQTIAKQAFGPSMDGVPATTEMNFRNGAVAFSYVSILCSGTSTTAR